MSYKLIMRLSLAVLATVYMASSLPLSRQDLACGSTEERMICAQCQQITGVGSADGVYRWALEQKI